MWGISFVPRHSSRIKLRYLIDSPVKPIFCGLSPFTKLAEIPHSLRAGWSGDRTPVAARFSAPVHNGPAAHPASYTKGTGSFPGGGGKAAEVWR